MAYTDTNTASAAASSDAAAAQRRAMMDGPVVRWTVADLFKTNSNKNKDNGNKLFMLYHCMGAGWDVTTPLGCLLGAGIHGVRRSRHMTTTTRTRTLLQTMATTSLIMGCVGLVAGGVALAGTARKGEKARIPWTTEGIQQRVDGLSHNFKVRVLDLSAWSGMAVATGALVVAGGPTALRMAPGTLGVLQTLALGSSVGSMAAFGCIYSVESRNVDVD